jgi:hypothetical protein
LDHFCAQALQLYAERKNTANFLATQLESLDSALKGGISCGGITEVMCHPMLLS